MSHNNQYTVDNSRQDKSKSGTTQQQDAARKGTQNPNGGKDSNSKSEPSQTKR